MLAGMSSILNKIIKETQNNTILMKFHPCFSCKIVSRPLLLVLHKSLQFDLSFIVGFSARNAYFIHLEKQDFYSYYKTRLKEITVGIEFVTALKIY